MAIAPAFPDCATAAGTAAAPTARGLERILRMLSVLTMAMTLPQVFAIWIARDAAGVSLISWAAYLFSACLWFVYGFRKRDKTIYLACIGWILLDAAIVLGIAIYR
jgi:uncharacterized protein with PQ loop repeat